MSVMCECSDPGCPGHTGSERCWRRATVYVRRIDMEDGRTGFWFCQTCADDALASGVFDCCAEGDLCTCSASDKTVGRTAGQLL